VAMLTRSCPLRRSANLLTIDFRIFEAIAFVSNGLIKP
jgi:hypothetical protein